ncbi:Phosphatidic acid phosphatase type 2 domain containing protein 1B [Entamoeba marina]
MSDIPKPIPLQMFNYNSMMSESCSYASGVFSPLQTLIPPRGRSPLPFDDTSMPNSNAPSTTNSRVGSRRTDLMSPLDFFNQNSEYEINEDFFIFR